MSKSSEYWARRYKLIEQACHDISLEYLEEMEKKYRDAEQTIQAKINAWYGRFADNNNISMAEAKKWLNDKELEELKWNVEQYIKYGKQNAIDGKWAKELENASARFHISRLEALKLECRQQIEQLTGGMTDDVDSVMQDTYREGYYRSLYEVQKGVSVGFDVAALDTNLVKRIVNKPWHIDGSDFSSSIWSNKAKLLGVIDKEISKMVLTGSSPEKTIRAIQNQMHTSKSNAQRLVLTESAYFTTRAQADSYGELGVELYEVVGTLDKRTCDFCGSFDGKKFPVAEMEVGVNAPPFHPRCRCTTYPYDEDSDVFGVGTRAARDENGKTYYVPGDMTFEEWKKKFVDGDKAGLKEIKSDDKMELKNKISDADAKITDLKKQFSDITDGYSYDEWFKDFKSIEEGYGEVSDGDETFEKLKALDQNIKDTTQKKTELLYQKERRKQLDTGYDGKVPDDELDTFNTKALEQIKLDTGYSDGKATEFQNALHEYFGGDYAAILSGETQTAKIIRNGIERMPVYDGSINRGMIFDNSDVKAFTDLQIGDELPQKGIIESWSSESGTAIAFSGISDYERSSVIIKCVDNKTAVGVQHLSSFGSVESEVLSCAKYEVIEIVTQSKYDYLSEHNEYLYFPEDLENEKLSLKENVVCIIKVKEKS